MPKSTRKPIRAKKKFVVIAYDITTTKRRNKIVKILEKAGTRINYSVFECMITDPQFKRIQKDIEKIIDKDEDRVVYYPICMKCYSKLIYQLPQSPAIDLIKVV